MPMQAILDQLYPPGEVLRERRSTVVRVNAKGILAFLREGIARTRQDLKELRARNEAGRIEGERKWGRPRFRSA